MEQIIEIFEIKVHVYLSSMTLSLLRQSNYARRCSLHINVLLIMKVALRLSSQLFVGLRMWDYVHAYKFLIYNASYDKCALESSR